MVRAIDQLYHTVRIRSNIRRYAAGPALFTLLRGGLGLQCLPAVRLARGSMLALQSASPRIWGGNVSEVLFRAE